jgi:hypothetical protein
MRYLAKIVKDVNETIGLNETVSGTLTQFVAEIASANSHHMRISSIAMTAACTMWASGVYSSSP